MSEELKEWYNTVPYEEIKSIIRDRMSVMAREYVGIGFYLRRVRDNEMYLKDGYKDVHEFAMAEFGMSRSTVNHCIRINEQFSVGGNSPTIDSRYKDFNKSQLQEMLYLPEDNLDDVTPDMTVKEIRSMKNDRLDVEPKMDSPIPEQMSIEDYPECMPENKIEDESDQEPVSVLGYPRRVYPEGSLIATAGCGKYDCFCCHREGCEIRGKECDCVESTMANPYTCTVLNVVDSIRQDIGNKCQFVNKDLAFHRAGDGEPVPCCKECSEPCGYECRRSVVARHELVKKNICDDARDETIEEKHCTSIDELDFSVRTYNVLKRAGVDTIEELQSMTGAHLIMIRNMSKRCIDEVRSKLEEYARNKSEKPVGDVSQDANHDIDNNNEDNVVINNEEYVVEPAESVIEADESVIEAEAQQDPEDIDNEQPEEFVFKRITAQSVLKEARDNLDQYLDAYKDEDVLPEFIEQQKIIVNALAAYVNDLEKSKQPEPEQPELPILKNNDQRKEWLKNYKDWGLWYRDENIDVNYYKYDFCDGSRLVVAEYPQREGYWNREPEDEYFFHFLQKDKKKYESLNEVYDEKFRSQTDSETYMVEFLKEVQKK